MHFIFTTPFELDQVVFRKDSKGAVQKVTITAIDKRYQLSADKRVIDSIDYQVVNYTDKFVTWVHEESLFATSAEAFV